MDGKIEELKKEESTLKTSIMKLLDGIIDENAKQGKGHCKTTGHRQATG